MSETGRQAVPSDQDASGRTLGESEIAAVRDVLESGVLTSTRGPWVAALEQRFAEILGVRHVVATSSGTAAVHAAIAALDPEPGDEVITTPITDMGAIAPIVYQSAVPVFTDVDARTGNVTGSAIEDRISDRTRVIIATHLFGNPADMPAITRLARRRGIPVIEDCCQAYLARSQGQLVGTMGAVSCFSLQQGKHVTTGEGGLVATDDDGLARRIRLFVNKAWPYGEQDPDHEFLALNSRMSELQGAVGRAQIDKLESVVGARIGAAARLTKRVDELEGVDAPRVASGDEHTYWRYALHVDTGRFPEGPDGFAGELRAQGIASTPRYVKKPAFQTAVIAERRTFGDSGFPFTLARPEALDYASSRFPGTFEFLSSVLVLPWNERLGDDDVDHIGDRIQEVARSTEGVTP
ncbi:MAG: DegT/DnrJ/EryC1/StrS family aminotransferase [Actinomycetota bacterium]|nr:DegT/DnrJ/EryC1/StrS family aminotransferase [Actinomycetota bacterium]